MESVLEAIEQGREHSIEILKEFLSIPSVSADAERRADVRRAAEFLARLLEDAGFPAVEVVPTAAHPIVTAEWVEAPEAPTLLVYGHYDVQPVPEPSAWSSPPFTPEVRGGRIWARGATDDKGQLLVHVLAARAHLARAGRLPVNVKFVVEGEEEVGSRALEAFVRDQRERLACDAVMISDTAMFAPGVPSVCTGLRGIAYVELTLRGPATDLHSGSFGGAVENPAVVLAHLIASLKDVETGRVLIEGFYDAVREPSEEERKAWASLPAPEERYAAMTGSPRLHGEVGYTVLERLWARPTLDVNGIWGGHTRPGESMTVLPARASAKVSMRLVADQDPADIVRKLRSHVEKHLPQTVCLESFHDLHGAAPWTTPLDPPAVQAAFRALKKGFGLPPVPTREGGSIPIVPLFAEVLRAPVVLMGLGLPDDGAHGPDEHFDLENFQGGIRSAAHYLEELRQACASAARSD